ncbi:MAG: VanZ family protein [Clostridiales bacterium]|nr:VanZ family protein [Clostridiales bacterium]
MRKYIPFILILLMLILIFGSSSVNGPDSYSASGVIAQFVKKSMAFLGDNNYSISTIEIIIRKLAHFFEYLMLTILLSIGFSNIMRNKWLSLLLGGFIGFTVSLLDEGFIQAASSRNSSILDVFIDLSGIVTGMLVLVLFFMLSIRLKK